MSPCVARSKLAVDFWSLLFMCGYVFYNSPMSDGKSEVDIEARIADVDSYVSR